MKAIVYQVDTYYNSPHVTGRHSHHYYNMCEYLLPQTQQWCKDMGHAFELIRPDVVTCTRNEVWPETMRHTINTIPRFAESEYDYMLFLDFDIYVPERYEFPFREGVIQAPSYPRNERYDFLKAKVKEMTGLETTSDSYLFCAVAMSKDVARRLNVPMLTNPMPSYNGTVYSNDELTLLYHADSKGVPFEDIKGIVKHSGWGRGNHITHFGGDGKDVIRSWFSGGI